VWGKGTLIGQHISNTQTKQKVTIWPVAAGDEKSIPALKFNIFMGHD
jgi:hypothetical protein